MGFQSLVNSTPELQSKIRSKVLRSLGLVNQLLKSLSILFNNVSTNYCNKQLGGFRIFLRQLTHTLLDLIFTLVFENFAVRQVINLCP